MNSFSSIDLGIVGGLILLALTALGGILFLFLRHSLAIRSLLSTDFFTGFILAAAVFGLIVPAFQKSQTNELSFLTFISLLVGAILLYFFDHILNIFTVAKNNQHRRAYAFILAMILHNFPEGLAAGATLSVSNSINSYSVILALGLQNIPEGFATGMSLLTLGIGPTLAFVGVILTGLIELFGGMFGGILNSFLTNKYPLILAFAGGAMIKIVIQEIFNTEKTLHLDTVRIFNKNFFLGFSLMSILSI